MTDFPEPGTVAMVTHGSGYECRAIRKVNGWICPDGIDTAHHPDNAGHIIGYRPLVVLDLNDRAEMVGIAQAVGPVAAQPGEDISHIRIAIENHLRSLLPPTEPPEPAEPTGKYAEVEDGRGWLYFRDPSGEWRLASNVVTPRRWSDISAVRVLSEGVTP